MGDEWVRSREQRVTCHRWDLNTPDWKVLTDSGRFTRPLPGRGVRGRRETWISLRGGF